ncbi:TIGR04255 family protein [Undibacterium sp. CY18W]|uniref:TIGR04255 family protein n=2 Tax=Undibacterium hunanense TaxID=2762292 RepID=A0ABR6ZM06_9BURK|nr:TIGR04255 family protein [Undibacterium hunanense]
MAIGVEWIIPLSDADLEHLLAVYKNSEFIVEFLPSFSHVRSFVLQMTDVHTGFIPENRSGGFDIRRFDTNGTVLWSISVRPDYISCNCMDYERWATVKPKTIDLLEPFVSAILNKGTQIQAVGLQYHDAFKIADKVSPEVLSTLFRRKSSWVPEHLFDMPSIWHVHQGWFSISPKKRRILNNVKLELLDQSPDYMARIIGQHRVFSLTHDGKESHPIELQDLSQVLDFLHLQNKNALRALLTDQMLERIGFDLTEEK